MQFTVKLFSYVHYKATFPLSHKHSELLVLFWLNVLLMHPCVDLQPCNLADCCHSLWSGLVQPRWRSDRIRLDTSPCCRSYAGDWTNCRLHLRHGRWNRSSYWCGIHTWQVKVEERLREKRVCSFSWYLCSRTLKPDERDVCVSYSS